MRTDSLFTIPRSFALLLCLAYAASVSVDAQQRPVDESQVRAMIIVNLTKFIDWPSDRNDLHSPFVVCAVGMEAVGADLETSLVGKTVKGRTVVVRRGIEPEQAEPCHILYLARPKRSQSAELSATLAKASVLTVSEDRPGTVIALPLVDGRVQIQVNRPLAQVSSLTLSSQLLQIAQEGR